MTSEQLYHYMKDRLTRVMKTCEVKTREYAKGDDPFTTIRRLAVLNEVSPSKMCMMLTSKHFLSLFHDIDTLTLDQINDRLDDIHVYIEYAGVLKNE